MDWCYRRSRFQGGDIGIDPLADWLFRSGGLSCDPPRRATRRGRVQEALMPLPLLIHLASDKTARDLKTFMEVAWPNRVSIPKAYTEAKSPWDEASYCTAYVPPDIVCRFPEYPDLKKLIVGVTISAPPTPVLLGPGPPIADRGKAHVRPGAVVMGLIDNGLCLASERFRTAQQKTRLVSAWLQQPAQPLIGPPAFSYGREIPTNEIDGYLGKHLVDEDDVYQRLGLFDPRYQESIWSQYRITHATHVLDRAAGYAPSSDPANDRSRPIIAVQFPEVVVADGSGHSLGAHVLDGLRYIAATVEEQRDDTAKPPPPVVVNISYGNSAGPHDGSSDIEGAMDDVIKTWSKAHPNIPFVIVLPAGNSFQAQGHARLTGRDLANDHPCSLTWQIYPDCGTASLVQLWLPPGFPSRDKQYCSLQVTTPDGLSALVTTKSDHLAELVDADGMVLAQALYSPPSGGQIRGMFQICVAPTIDPAAIGQKGKHPAPHGGWRLRVVARGLPLTSDIQIWIQRNDLPRDSAIVARQSIFVDDYYLTEEETDFPVEVDDARTPIKRRGSFNAIATGSGPIVVGASYRRLDMARRWPKIAPYSGGGDGGGYGVDLTADAEESVVISGLRGAGTRSAGVPELACIESGTVRMNGTSVAAPAVARAIADHIDLFADQPAKCDVLPLLHTGNEPTEPMRDPRIGWGIWRAPAACPDRPGSSRARSGPSSR